LRVDVDDAGVPRRCERRVYLWSAAGLPNARVGTFTQALMTEVKRGKSASQNSKLETSLGNSKSEARNPKQVRMTEMEGNPKRFERNVPEGRFAGAVFRALFFSSFGIVSDFVIRFSDLDNGFGFQVFGMSPA